MADRFERLFQLPIKQYAEGAPIILSAGVLSKDTQTGSIFVQLKFQSVSEKKIKAVKVSLAAYDVSKIELQGVTDYQYLELNVSNGQEFGSNKAIVMPNSVTRSFAVTSVFVVFDDESVWESAGNFAVLPVFQSLSFALGNAELEKQYRIETNDRATYVPVEHQGLWQCACGAWNKGTTCTHCNLLKVRVFNALDTKALAEQMNIRLAEEQEQRDAEAARQAQLRAEAEIRREKNKKRLRKVAFAAIAAVILFVAGIVIYNEVTELTIEKMLALYTEEDVVALLGKPDENSGITLYDASFMGEDYSLMFTFSNSTLSNWSMRYSYPGIDELASIYDIYDYEITVEDKEAANTVVLGLVESFKEKFGDPQVKTEKNTTSYTWIVNDRMIEVLDYTGNRALSLVSAVSIRVNCDHQSFCEHTDMKSEHFDVTCVEDGYDRTTCTVCGYVDETTIKAPGHKNTITITKEPTCTAQGEETHECEACGNKETKAIAVLPHTNRSVVTKEPTCTSEGIEKHTCTECGNVTEEKVAKAAHSYAETVIKQASCTTTGTKSQKCSFCGDTQKSVTIPATGHDYGQYAIDEATCTTSGTRYMKCINCGDEYTDAIDAFGHSWETASCTKAKHCQNCGLTEGEPLGHSWSHSTTYSDPSKCYRCGEVFEPKVVVVLDAPGAYTSRRGDTVNVTSISYEVLAKNMGGDMFEYLLHIYVNGTTDARWVSFSDSTLHNSFGEKIRDSNYSSTVYPEDDGTFSIRLDYLFSDDESPYIFDLNF